MSEKLIVLDEPIIKRQRKGIGPRQCGRNAERAAGKRVGDSLTQAAHHERSGTRQGHRSSDESTGMPTTVDSEHDKGERQQQHMYRIKSIADVPKRLGVISLPPVVQPDRQQRQQRQPLLRERHRMTEDRDRQQFTGQALAVDPVQPRKLRKPLPPGTPSARRSRNNLSCQGRQAHSKWRCRRPRVERPSTDG